jgi:hypothetical protein
MTSSGIHNVKIFPNPVSKNHFSAEFYLENKSKLNFALHNLSGHFLMDLKSAELNEGLQKIVLPLKEKIKAGLYLLSITSDRGDNVVQKLIIE